MLDLSRQAAAAQRCDWDGVWRDLSICNGVMGQSGI